VVGRSSSPLDNGEGSYHLMAEIRYCWRCRTEVRMFDEIEWPRVRALLFAHRESIKHIRKSTGAMLDEAVAASDTSAIRALHLSLTGAHFWDPEALWHHRLADCGPACRACGKPLRTSTARICAECGAAVV
jgi:hypothetical protein